MIDQSSSGSSTAGSKETRWGPDHPLWKYCDKSATRPDDAQSSDWSPLSEKDVDSEYKNAVPKKNAKLSTPKARPHLNVEGSSRNTEELKDKKQFKKRAQARPPSYPPPYQGKRGGGGGGVEAEARDPALTIRGYHNHTASTNYTRTRIGDYLAISY
jgi:hypothetical protein